MGSLSLHCVWAQQELGRGIEQAGNLTSFCLRVHCTARFALPAASPSSPRLSQGSGTPSTVCVGGTRLHPAPGKHFQYRQISPRRIPLKTAMRENRGAHYNQNYTNHRPAVMKKIVHLNCIQKWSLKVIPSPTYTILDLSFIMLAAFSPFTCIFFIHLQCAFELAVSRGAPGATHAALWFPFSITSVSNHSVKQTLTIPLVYEALFNLFAPTVRLTAGGPWHQAAAYQSVNKPVQRTSAQQKAPNCYLRSGAFRSCDSQSRWSHDHKPPAASETP